MEIHIPTLNAILNGTALILLLIGRALIAKGKKEQHARIMGMAFFVSTLFLASYLYYHFTVQQETRFTGEGISRILYYIMLISHIVLASIILPLVLKVLFHARKQEWEKHKKLAKFVWPLWLYVSATGIGIYLALYSM